MQHFSQVYDVCRAALAGDVKLARGAVNRLQKALVQAGDTDGAQLLSRLLKATSGAKKGEVMHFVQSESGR
jgi:hypothetical protein